MIHGVTGPNEYENNVNNNYHTNHMATWTLQYTLDALKKVSPREMGRAGPGGSGNGPLERYCCPDVLSV